MIETIPYDSKFDSGIGKLDESHLNEILHHEDIVKESVTLALCDGELIGSGYLLRTPGNYVSLVFKTDLRTAAGIDAAEALLTELMRRFRLLKRNAPGLVCRLWCGAEESAYQSFLSLFGFAPADTMYKMVCPLTAAGKETALPDGYVIRTIDLHDPAVMREYMRVNGSAFGIPDSEKEMLFRTGYADGIVSAVMKDTELVAAVTTWPVSGKRAATENIFCADKYRRQGFTSALIRSVQDRLFREGYREAVLYVYDRDRAARKLYQKLGYTLERVETELQAE